jgi:hypothetical protein
VSPEEELAAKGLVPIPTDTLRDAYGKAMVLDFTADALRAEGLQMDLGPLVGKHRFVKASHQAQEGG